MAVSLLARFSEDYTEANVADLRRAVQELALAGPWTRERPRFIDEVEGDLRTVGVLLTVSEPDETPVTSVDEATRMLEAVATFSAKHGTDVEVDFAQETIGTIFNGVMDRGIREGLLANW